MKFTTFAAAVFSLCTASLVHAGIVYIPIREEMVVSKGETFGDCPFGVITPMGCAKLRKTPRQN
ncbi:hypothetical protein VTJ04DRAFT_2665 [Mycothermus thermophilus]|uniref:uncharacterized protein n=1 Tax=Humicola insolens TaxID=85995 RepID=UPI0037442CCB